MDLCLVDGVDLVVDGLFGIGGCGVLCGIVVVLVKFVIVE